MLGKFVLKKKILSILLYHVFMSVSLQINNYYYYCKFSRDPLPIIFKVAQMVWGVVKVKVKTKVTVY